MSRALSRTWTLLAAAALLASSRAALGQCEPTKLVGADAAAGDELGVSVSVSGTRVLAGANVDDTPGGVNAGSAYVFEWDGADWTEVARLLASDGAYGHAFGSAVSIDGDRALVGALNAADGRGALYVFERRPSGWVQTAILTATDTTSGSGFGSVVALDGNVAVSGAFNAFGGAPYSGALYVFQLGGAGWKQTAKLVASDAQFGDNLGCSVAVSEGIIAAGAVGTASGEGSSYVFEEIAGSWIETARLLASDAAPDARFGSCVAVAGGLVAVGSILADGDAAHTGAVYLFERDGAGSWGPTETQKIFASDGQTNDKLGSSLSLSGARLLVAAHTDDDAGSSSGSAYLFERTGGHWEQTAKLLAPDGAYGDLFGSSVALAGELAVIGARLCDDVCPAEITCNSGAAYLFRVEPMIRAYGFGLGCPCGNEDPVRGCRNSSGHGALLAACGTTSVAADDLVLTASGLPAQQPAIVFMGWGTLDQPFGDGRRCVGAGSVGIFRYVPPQSSGPAGTFTLGPGIVSASRAWTDGEIAAGDTWYFQTWYRDPMGSPCGAAFNLSNGVAATFVP